MSWARTFLIAVLSTACTAAAAQTARVGALDWLAGTWMHAAGEERVTETWLGPAAGVMVAANLTVGPRGRANFEFIRIAETGDGFSYFASPGGRAPVEFKLKEIGERRVVFENPAHDFPQRVLYWREGEALMARIEGSIAGKERHRSWRFVRQ